MKRALVLPLLALGLPFVGPAMATPASAETPPAETRQTIVAYADLDLSRNGDIAKLYERLDAASRRICRSLNAGRTSDHRRAYEVCWADAMTNAAAGIGNDQVSALIESIVDPAGRGGAKRQFADRGPN